MITNFAIGGLTIDCADAARSRDFYAGLMGWEKTAADYPALITDNGLIITFAKTDIPYEPPIWPEEPGKQQKQMHLDFVVDDLPSAVQKAVRLGAAKPTEQYGDYYVTMLDTEGRPFCLCRRSQNKSEFDVYFENKGWGTIPAISINIDCKKTEILRAFYAGLTDWDQGFHHTALIADNKMVVHFMGCDGDFDYIPPVWPEALGKQQKQMRFTFRVGDVQSAAAEAIRLGAVLVSGKHDGNHPVTLLDTEGHPFNLSSQPSPVGTFGSCPGGRPATLNSPLSTLNSPRG